jgi:MinD-like ATPase involved in chromosome partitioning or flagellar assembly
MKSFWITFYSYKGGVGRTLALANVAALLVQAGRRVVLIDFDLEAPGLDSFQDFENVRGKQGVVEYVSDFNYSQKAPKIQDYVYSCQLPQCPRGQLWVMPAGKKDGLYNRKRLEINWSNLFETGIGLPFIENWKAAIDEAYHPDYVLIDSRTGLTDVGGICTLGFPNLVMMLFGLNSQNVEGTAAVAKTLSQADPERVPQLCYIATPVPNLNSETDSAIAKRFQDASKLLAVPVELTISYFAPASLEEKLFVLTEKQPQSVIVNEYKNLVESITAYNRGGLEFLAEQVDKVSRGEGEDIGEKLMDILQRDYADRSEGKYLLARLSLAKRDIEEAEKFFEESLEIEPTFLTALDYLYETLRRQNKFKKIHELFTKWEPFYAAKGGDSFRKLLVYNGQACMVLSFHKKALDAFLKAIQNNETCEYSAGNLLVCVFNAAEARRRLTKKIHEEDWNKVINLFIEARSASGEISPHQANQFQAMYVAYACVGRYVEAHQALIKAAKVAQLVSEVDNIFSVKDYLYVHKKEFLAINKAMLAALDRSELWDGMKIPIII